MAVVNHALAVDGQVREGAGTVSGGDDKGIRGVGRCGTIGGGDFNLAAAGEGGAALDDGDFIFFIKVDALGHAIGDIAGATHDFGKVGFDAANL